ncbi:MAG: hypothetical protein DRQ88_03520 [Epsilonproteobacteria bacterium]|nr:MAG: hypothetical protein DRQ89_03970 [Campylobacterota bacterium]RLA67243.1 MAG: hypothetical protein DRQ88_03520 [Campylobacterota bacterium]
MKLIKNISSFKDLEKTVFSYPKLKELIDKDPSLKKQADKYLYEMAADYRPSTIYLIGKVLDLALGELYDDVNFQVGGGGDLTKLCKENHVVLVPNHQSHADYLVMSWVCIKKYSLPIFIAGGLNLNIFPIGKIFRTAGCFFIRRSFKRDGIYKVMLEAYLYYLLYYGETIEFFFEGGRSRTGKLLPPKYGLFNLLLEAHSKLPPERKKKLIFQPISIIHESVPEQRTMAQELMGEKKKKESFFEILKVFKIFAKQFGSLHIFLGTPIDAPIIENLTPDKIKKTTYHLAFRCFRRVGKNMAVTPSSLLSLILLEEPSGAIKWNAILEKGRAILDYCEQFDVHFTPSLKKEKFLKTMERAMDIMLGNKKVHVIGRGEGEGQLLYQAKKDTRIELLYSKNTILHQFLVPWTINSVWIHIFNGTIKDEQGLREYLLNSRNQLKHEFYLPTTQQYLQKTLNVISHAIGREVTSLADCLTLDQGELYLVAKKLGVFARAGNYIHEVYYINALTLKELGEEKEQFSMDDVVKKSAEIFKRELKIEKHVKYPESYSTNIIKSSMNFFLLAGYVQEKSKIICLNKDKPIDSLIADYKKFLEDSWAIVINPGK